MLSIGQSSNGHGKQMYVAHFGERKKKNTIGVYSEVIKTCRTPTETNQISFWPVQ